MKRSLLLVAVLSLTGTAIPQDQPSDRAAMIARAQALEIPTPYVPPPGDPLAHHASGFAKIMCSAVFITGLDPDFAAANVGGFTSPFDTYQAED
jgi:hypothetical protein